MSTNDDNHQQNQSKQSAQDPLSGLKAVLNTPIEKDSVVKKFKKIRGNKGQTFKYAMAGVLVLTLTASLFYIIQRRTEPVPTAPESLPEAAEEQPCTLNFSIEEPTRTISGTVYCQDDGGSFYALEGWELTIDRYFDDSGYASGQMKQVGSDGSYEADITGTEKFSVLLPVPRPQGELNSGQPYSAMEGPFLTNFDYYCETIDLEDGAYIKCDSREKIDHQQLNFRFTNCEPTPTPTLTPPSPTPTPVTTEPQCIDLSALYADEEEIIDPHQIEENSELLFVCTAHDPDGQVAGYQFQILQYSPENDEYIPIELSGIQTDVDWEHTFQEAGAYIVQCRICKSLIECQDWENINGVSEESLCDTCACSGTGYETVTCDGDTVYVDCSSDTCWTPAYTWYNWNNAMSLCADLNYGGSSNWSLPSPQILGNLCNSESCNCRCFGGDGPVNCYYWSSTEISGDQAYYYNFDTSDGCQSEISPKTQGLAVRCYK